MVDLGIPTTHASISDHKKKTLSFKDVYKIYVSPIVKWCRLKQSDSNSQSSSHTKSQVSQEQDIGEEMNGIHSCIYNSDTMRRKHFSKPKSVDNCFPRFTSPLTRSSTRRSPSPTPSFMSRSGSKAANHEASFMSRSGSRAANNEASYRFTSPLSRNTSRRSTTPIMFSNSSGMLKPQPVLKNLECTLEELCYGCTKKIKVTRDVLTRTGKVVKEEEILTINVKPGWKEGTKITFEGMGNETPGGFPADITFVVAEKHHPLFRREGDDLEIAVEISLVKALTGCEIQIPLLGGQNMSLSIKEIIYPGYHKIIKEQGMPSNKEHGKRGNLKVLFLVEFPKSLTDDQRADILNILEDSF